jgi:hypothetical protein
MIIHYSIVIYLLITTCFSSSFASDINSNHFILGWEINIDIAFPSYKVIPHPEKFQKGGEDAYYVNP